MTTPPPILYKYLDPEGAIKTLENCTLKFSSPLELNDPFEGLFATITDEQVKYIIGKLYEAQKSIELWIFVLKDYLNISRVEAVSLWEGLGHHTSVEQIVHTTMNHFGEAWKDFHKKELAKIAISSFSETPTNLQMWAHYAKKHTGCVVGIFSVAFDFWFKVKYSSERIPQPLTEEEIKLVSIDSIRTKDTQWEHEKEWRLASHASELGKDEEKNLILPIAPKTIATIVLGVKCDERVKEAALNFIKKSKRACLQSAVIHPNDYAICLRSRNADSLLFWERRKANP